MSAVGTWELTLATRMGDQHSRLHVSSHSEEVIGWLESPDGNLDFSGAAAGNTLKWTVKMTRPVPLKVGFDLIIDGDKLKGSAKLGLFGKADVSGRRIANTVGDGEAPAEPDPAVFVTADSVDPLFNEPYIEINELRNEPVAHRYIHGGFKNTDARFSFYFPPEEQYQGRFFHNTYPLATTSDIAPFPIAFDVAIGNLGFTFDSGAYYVQTNLGGGDREPPADPAIAAYRVNAAAAKYSRTVAAELYGDHRPFGYLFGGSGGSYQVVGSAENTAGVWDGFLPYVLATPNAIPSMFTVRMHALRILKQRNCFGAIMDAIEPGGNGDPYAELNDEERAALTEATRMGFPLAGWWNHAEMTSGYFGHVAGIVPMLDPDYLEDFWSKSGYLGSDPDSSIRELRDQFETRIKAVTPGLPPGVELVVAPDRDFSDAHLVRLNGEAQGQSTPITTINGATATFSYSADPEIVSAIKPGDAVRLDNSWPLALQTYHRHQVPDDDMCGWDQFLDANGKPVYPQREVLTGEIAAAGTAGSVPCGRISGKLLLIECMMDIDALPWQADWYRSRVREQLDADFEDQFALWYIDHAQHDNPPPGPAQAHAVGFEGALQQGLRDLAAWVEKGSRPADMRYAIHDAQIELPDSAAERGGIQPIVELQANGGERAEVTAGTPVEFTATIDTPPGSGRIVNVEWDFTGQGDFAVSEPQSGRESRLQLQTTQAYTAAGTYFAVLRVTTQRDGDTQTPYTRVQNIARVRVIVRPS